MNRRISIQHIFPRRHALIVLFSMLLFVQTNNIKATDNERLFRMEIGVDGGLAYYVGDATPHIFQNIRETYGAAFRYQLDRRWALRVKGMELTIAGNKPNGTGFADRNAGMWTNRMVNIDVVGEFNFFQYGSVRYDKRISPLTPYIGIGIGVGLHSNWQKVSAYIPFIIGLKWQALPQMTIHAIWQHNVYFADNIENVSEYNNTYKLNGGNIMNCDVTGQLAIGLAFSFLQDRKICRTCK